MQLFFRHYRQTCLQAAACVGLLLLSCLAEGCSPFSRPVYPTYTPTPITPTPTPTLTPVWFPPTITPTPLPSSTPLAATPDPHPETGALIYTDTFHTPALWTSRQIADASAAFGKDELTLAITGSKVYVYSLRLNPLLGDFYAELTANPVFCRGLDEYGWLVRAASPSDYYRIGVSCDGQAHIDRVLESSAAALLTWQYGPGIPPGGPSLVRLGVWARGGEIGLLANNQLVLTINDPKLASGGLGVYARSASNLPVTVNFSDLSVWEVK